MGVRPVFGMPIHYHITVHFLMTIQPLDLTLLDQHFGNIEEWRRAVDAIHERGMYVILDNTVAT